MLEQPSPPPLHRYPLIETGLPDEFCHLLVTRFGARTVDLGGGPQGFRATRSYVQMRNVDLVFGKCTSSYRVHFTGGDLVKQHFAMRHRGRTSFGGLEFIISQDEAPVIPADVEMTHEYEPDFEQLMVRIEGAALQAKLSAVAGLAIARNIEFSRPSRMQHPALQRLRRMLKFLISELDRADEPVPPAALAEFEQLLIVSFLSANRHNFSELMEREPPRTAPWQVRRVEEYIEANWNQPITVEALAGAAGASTRSVFKAFREARHCSPMAFVKGIRLGNARRMLQRPELGTSVVSVAFACGFLNPGHFARDYRLAFGELPSVTLAQARHTRH